MEKEIDYLEWFNSKSIGFEMFTNAGDKKCKAITKKALKKVFGKARVTQDQLEELVKAELKKAEVKYPEIYDSEPPYHISYYINKGLDKVGYGFKVDSYNF